MAKIRYSAETALDAGLPYDEVYARDMADLTSCLRLYLAKRHLISPGSISQPHVRAFETIGVPELAAPDNAKTAIAKTCFRDPEVNRTLGRDDGALRNSILPARPRKPRDKAKVEQAVLIVERWLLGRLRRRTYRSLICTSSWSWLFNLTNRTVGHVAASAIPSASQSSTS